MAFLFSLICRIISACRNRISLFYWRRYIHVGNHTYIIKPLRIKGSNIFIGNHVIIQECCWLECQPLTSDPNPSLIIKDGSIIGHYNEIFATKQIIIENNVLTADRVYISDNLHGYSDIDTPIIQQPIIQKRTVKIGEGSWLGVGVTVIGANIGKHCVIGANAVVTHDIPDYSVAVGIPAKVIKRYNFDTNQWEKT